MSTVQLEIEKLLKKDRICETRRERNDSQIFLPETKLDGGKGMALNLRQFKRHIAYDCFKIEPINHFLDIITPNAYMASIELKDSFFLKRIYLKHQQYSL